MNTASNPLGLFTQRSRSYERFVRVVRYPQGIRAFFSGSSLLRPGLHILDAGCGTGVVTLALREALSSRRLSLGPMQGFELTPAMLERFHQILQSRGIDGVSIVQGDVLELDALPRSWSHYDLIVSASMLEYLPRDQLVAGLSGLRALLNPEGSLLLFITRRNGLTRPLIGQWWQANLYTAAEIRDSLRRAGFSTLTFERFPAWFRHLALWGYIVQARG